MFYLRVHVDPIKRHFDPIVSLVDDNLVVVYGLAANDLMRLRSHLANLNQYGLIMVDRDNDRFRFLKFKQSVVAIYPGFKEVAEVLGLSVGFDFELRETNPQGAHYPIISSDSFVIAVKKASNPASWAKTNYIKELSALNLIHEEGPSDLFKRSYPNNLNTML